MKWLGEADQSSVNVGTHSCPGKLVARITGSSSSTAGSSNTGLLELPLLSHPGTLPLPATLLKLPTLVPPETLLSSSLARARALSRSARSRSLSARWTSARCRRSVRARSSCCRSCRRRVSAPMSALERWGEAAIEAGCGCCRSPMEGWRWRAWRPWFAASVEMFGGRERSFSMLSCGMPGPE
jgi:hypothetical protein